VKKLTVPLCLPSINDDDVNLVSDVLKSGWIAHGEYNEKFEQSFAEYVGANYALSLNSCTSALELALWMNDIKGEVLIPSFTWNATGNVVCLQGATPVFVDVDLDTFNMSLQEAEAKITSKTEAIIIVHYAGLCADIIGFRNLAQKHGLLLIEDSAEALGAEMSGVKAGSGGNGCFSFYPTKNITTCEGGMLTLNSAADYDKAKALAAHGVSKAAIDREKSSEQRKWYREAIYNGRNFRMPNPLAALGYSQLGRNESFNFSRNLIAKKYNEYIDAKDGIERQAKPENFTHSYQMYSILVDDKDATIKVLNEHGVMASSHFDPPLHKQTAFKDIISGSLPNTEHISQSVVTLPIFPEMTDEQLEYVIELLKII
jgi:perosamine synthetase